MIIIVEGLDRCGKTTLIQNLNTLLYKESPLNLKFSNTRNISPADHEQLYLDLFKKTTDLFFINKSVIIDRFILGEHVYGPLYRGYTTSQLREKEETWLKMYPHIADQMYLITLIDDPVNLKNREDELSLSKGNLSKITTERVAFINVFNACKVPHKLLIDINGKSIQEVYSLVKNFIKR